MNPTLVPAARKGAIYGIIISFSAAALVGIVALLGGDFGETQGKILLTTVLFGAFSITALCHLAIADRAMRVVGILGLLASGVGLVTGMVLIWRSWDSPGVDDWFRVFATAGIVAVSFAHANLLLLLAGRQRAAIRYGLMATLVAIGIVAIMLIVPVVTNGDIPGQDGDLYWRVFGVVAILDVLGTVVVPVLAIFLRDEPVVRDEPAAEHHGAHSSTEGSDAGHVVRVTVPADLLPEIETEAAVHGITVEQAAVDALRRGAAQPR